MKEQLIVRVVARLIITIFSLFVSYFLLLKLDVELIGVIAFSTSLIGLFTLFKDLGFGLIYFQHNSDKDFDDYFSIYFFLQTVTTFINFTPIFVLIFFLNLEPLVFSFLFLKVISELFLNLSLPWRTNLESRLKYIKLELVVLVINIVQYSLLLFLIFNLEFVENPLIILGQIYISISIIQLIIVLLISRREFQFNNINREKLKQFIKDTRPLIMMTVIGAILGNLGQVFINLFFGLEALAYYYFADAYIVSILLVISGEIHQILLTYIPKELKEDNFGNTEMIVHKIEKFSSMFFLIIVIIVFLNGELLLNIFLPNYSQAIIYLYILIFIPYLSSINRPYSALLIPFKKQKLSSSYTLVKSVIWTALIFILVPKELFSIKLLGLGSVGLAFIILSGHIIDVFFQRFFLKRIGINYEKKILYHILCAALALFLTYMISHFFLRFIIVNDLLYVLATSGLLAGIFILILIVFKEITREELKFFFTLLKVSAYKESLINEMKVKRKINNDDEFK